MSACPRILCLTEHLRLICRQLLGKRLAYESGRKLLDNTSTHEVMPAWACLYSGERLGHVLLTSLRGGAIASGEDREAGFDGIASGLTTGGGNSRETAPHGDEATVSAGNRNFPGRGGPGTAYPANSFVVAARALSGSFAWPDLGVERS